MCGVCVCVCVYVCVRCIRTCGVCVCVCTHVSAKEVVHLSLQSLLAVGVCGQQVAGKRQRVAARLVARQQKDEGLAHNLILRHHPLLRLALCRGVCVRPSGRLLAVLLGRAVDCVSRGLCVRCRANLVCLVDNVKLLERHRLLGRPRIKH